MVGREAEIGGGDEVVVPVDHLQIAEVGCTPKPFIREVPTAHLGGGVDTVRPGVHNLPAELHHARLSTQVVEQQGWPVAYQQP